MPTDGQEGFGRTAIAVAVLGIAIALGWWILSAEPTAHPHGTEPADHAAPVDETPRDPGEAAAPHAVVRWADDRDEAAVASREPPDPLGSTQLDASGLHDRAAGHLQAGRLGAARTDLRRLVLAFPDYDERVAAWLAWAEIEEQIGGEQRALCVYADLVAEHGDDPKAASAHEAVARLRDVDGVDPSRCP